MSRPLLTIVVFLALCSPFFLFGSGYTFSEENSISYIQEFEDKNIFTKEELSLPFYAYKTIDRKDFLLWTIKNSKTQDEINKFLSKNHPFIDIKKDEDISPYVVMGYISGGLDSFADYKKFLPNRGITKIEAITLFFALENINVNELSSSNLEKKVKDLPRDEKLKNFILLAIEKKYLEVDEKGFVYPNNLLKRGEALNLLHNYNLELKNIESIEKFSSDKKTFTKNKSTVSKAKELITNKYLKNENVTSETLDDSAIKGMVEALNDEYSEYLPPKEEEKFNDFINSDENINEEYAGLGVVVQKANGGGLVITQIFEEGPAYDIDLKVGDIITHVDDISIKNKSLLESIRLIKGPVSKLSTLTIDRSGDILHKEFRRRQISVDNLPTISNEIKDGILWIKVRSFKSFTSSAFAKILDDNINDNIKGIIIDLRYNGGGLMEGAQKMLGEILPENSVAVRLYTRDNEVIYRVDGSGNYTNIPLVIFQNEYSASASEIFSAAVKDYERGKIIGTSSYGKGVAQSVFNLDRGSLKLTIAEFKSPLQNIINKKGVTPDVKMEKFDNISYFMEAKKYLNK